MSKKKEAGVPIAIHDTFSYGVIYVYSIPGGTHKGRLKIGSATVQGINPTQADIDAAAHARIGQQTKTADIPFTLEHAELALTNDGNYFRDHHVHSVLERSGYKRKAENVRNTHSEWFEVGLDKTKSAITAVKEGREALSTRERNRKHITPFQFRPNQRQAIDKTTKAIKKNRKRFLWNAKMRFGKTAAAMQVARENKMTKVIIVTHRPSVSVDWRDDFNKVFAGTKYEYSSRKEGEKLSKLLQGKNPFVYFASLQDLRNSKRVVEDKASGSEAEGFEKNDDVFDTPWDMLIVDEAHEGTQSNLGDTTFTNIPAKFTLQLSGTPFNILHKHEEEDIYTWDYVMEQAAKLHWDERYPGVPNPYAELPALSIFTYDIDTLAAHLGDLGAEYRDAQDGAFKFHEFLRVRKDHEGNDTAKFVHEKMVNKFLDLLVDDRAQTKFPYATAEYRNYNKHALWLLPNRVKVIEAMERLLEKHPVFGCGTFGIVNISGDNREDYEDKSAKQRVTKAIKTHDYSITLTGQRLTTGASIPEWTAVFMLSDTNSATTYLQTAFRCQTPVNIDGKFKTQGYVFDFAPDRTLKLVAEAIELNHKKGKINSDEQKEAMRQFLNFCPILAARGGMMRAYDVESMLVQLKKAIVERVSRAGFDDPALYNDELLKLNEVDIQRFNDLKAIVGTSNAERVNEIEINNLGMDDLQLEAAEKAERKQRQELTDEQREALKRLKEARDQRKTAITILRAVSIRMPMLVYGANVAMRDDITLEKFIALVDDESWREFMPAGLTKNQFREFIKYYDEDVFKAVARNIRAKAFDCDDLPPTERIQAIAEIFSTFKNPDKETVLTPWNVVNQHLTVAFGGHDFRSGVTDKTGKPNWISNDVDTSVWEAQDAKILEINSKSGLYPLLAAYNVYTRKLKTNKKPEEKITGKLWREVLSNNIFVLCKTPMAESITRRTIAGYSDAKTNIAHITDLVDKLECNEPHADYGFEKELLQKFNRGKGTMKFTAVVGNPPYQVNTETNFAKPVYHQFFEAAKSLAPDYVCLIHPARFLFNAGATPKEWNQKMLNDPHLSIKLYEPNTQKIFTGVDIKGGVCITFWDKNNAGGGLGGSFVAHTELTTILQKIKDGGFDAIVGARGETKLTVVLDKKYPSDLRIAPNYFDRFPEVFLESKSPKARIIIIGLEKGNKRTKRYVDSSIINDPKIEKWKVFLPKSNGAGNFGEMLSTPVIASPQTGCTYSFLQIGSFESKTEAANCMSYIKTKFCRAMLGTLKVTQDNPQKVWKNVPLQDFTDASEIDWSKSIPEIDQQLYKKYELDKREIDFIETHVKVMV
ncbi:MAG: Eco57I restriction-modification methylase domain-containing protein [Kiritimatiellia bacterium]